MEKKKGKKISRRNFINFSALGLTGLTILPSWSINGVKIAPSDRVVMGFIGLGRQGLSDFYSISGCPGVQVAACSDVDSLKTERFKRRVNKWQKQIEMNERCDKYEFYEALLERKDIDAISIATPDHWHALAAIHTCQSGKDVYLQKPLAYTITEGLAVQTAVRRHSRILQMGSQQRSSPEFQLAVKLVREGAIGHITNVYARVGEPPKPYDLPEQKIPVNLNFNTWMGPLIDKNIHYHSNICPQITLDPEQNETLWGAWRWYQELGNGFTADWGAHMFDIAQAALGMDGSGPIEFIPQGYKKNDYARMKYADGVIMEERPYREDNPNAKGLKFIGTKGWIEVARGFMDASDKSLITWKNKKKGAYEKNASHAQNFIDSIRSREDPIAPVEVGCSTNTLCCLNNIATELKRPVHWNPATLQFMNDKEAENHRLYWYQYRNPYTLPYCERR